MSTERYEGELYDRDLDVAEIAKRIRAELRAQHLDVYVRTRRFAGGGALDITIKLAHRAVALEAMQRAYDIARAYQYSRRDFDSDLYDTNFFLNVYFGRPGSRVEYHNAQGYAHRGELDKVLDLLTEAG